MFKKIFLYLLYPPTYAETMYALLLGINVNVRTCSSWDKAFWYEEEKQGDKKVWARWVKCAVNAQN